jgi:magnesium transporter
MENQIAKPWDRIHEMLDYGDPPAEIVSLLDALEPPDLLHAFYTLSPDDQRALLSVLTPERAALLVQELSDDHAADLIEDMPAKDAAPIVEEMASDHRVDVLSELDSDDADAIIAELDEEEANEVRELISYAPDQAGGLMMKEFASYPMTRTVREVVEDLTAEDVDYQFLTVHYIYVVVKEKKLKGVVRIRDLVFADPEKKIGEIVTRDHSCTRCEPG